MTNINIININNEKTGQKAEPMTDWNWTDRRWKRNDQLKALSQWRSQWWTMTVKPVTIEGSENWLKRPTHYYYWTPRASCEGNYWTDNESSSGQGGPVYWPNYSYCVTLLWNDLKTLKYWRWFCNESQKMKNRQNEKPMKMNRPMMNEII